MPRKKDANKVRKPMNAFFFYRNHLKAQLEEENSTTNSNEISKIAAAQWKKESEKVRKVYKDMSKKAYDEFKLKYPDFEWNHKKRIKREPERQDIPLADQERKALDASLASSPFGSSYKSSRSNSISDGDSVNISSPYSSLSVSDWSETYSDFDELVDSFIKEFNPSYPYQSISLN
ncbi:hypothetical protein HDV01_004717 [Terramyces sp. JEL0728]|nr:hypothetical protein HDV01_004717 [Terramyces sp. JEL0728]